MPDYDLAVWHGFNAPLVDERARDDRRRRSAMRGCAASSRAAASGERR